MTSLTPCQDAARRVCAAARPTEEASAALPGATGIAARIRLAAFDDLVIAAAAEIDNGADRADLDQAFINLVANLAASLSAMTRVGAVLSPSGEVINGRAALSASLLYDAMRVVADPRWSAAPEGPSENIDVVDPGPRQ